jgi:pimeloyl-ACP methyl ester carboxylesterase
MIMLMSADRTAGVEPNAMIRGLAVYRVGDGEPVLLMPYPHASTAQSMAESDLATALVESGRTVITFDPPGIFRSDRKPRITMDEMHECAVETISYFGIDSPIDIVGHSMGGFCALAFAVEKPEKVKRLAVIGTPSGWPAVTRWGVHQYWKWHECEWWQSRFWGFLVMMGWDNLLVHKKLENIVGYASVFDKSLASPLEIESGDRYRPAPTRSKWMRFLQTRKPDYLNALPHMDIPVLVCVGRHDPQTPVIACKELADGISQAEFVVFEQSGHAPFLEEPYVFTETLKSFLK